MSLKFGSGVGSADPTHLSYTGHSHGVSAAQPQVGLLGDICQLLLRVAERLGDGGAVLECGAPGGRAVALRDVVVDLLGGHFDWMQGVFDKNEKKKNYAESSLYVNYK